MRSGNPNPSITNLKMFPPGQSGNPGGKPKAARDRINKKFLEALSKDFDDGGKQAIAKCRETDPSAYVRALVALQPKEVEVSQSPLAELSDEQLESIFLACRAILAAESGEPGTGGQEGRESSQELPAVPQAG